MTNFLRAAAPPRIGQPLSFSGGQNSPPPRCSALLWSTHAPTMVYCRCRKQAARARPREKTKKKKGWSCGRQKLVVTFNRLMGLDALWCRHDRLSLYNNRSSVTTSAGHHGRISPHRPGSWFDPIQT